MWEETTQKASASFTFHKQPLTKHNKRVSFIGKKLKGKNMQWEPTMHEHTLLICLP